ncbi:uroporphyrinogen-III C-methyltransferase [Hyphomicrobium sp.]|uniref:uroporphyrinogen-III C-methyltransferase n=1 Tax=Hyphomicrobium sp. TaxID=82 RepID=UPI000FA04FCC|nr:uroporphyrinogen-III C-methyltransferase [Hyphomicrobium sp.]RUP09994.1 MAG: uroporphyrinogen-III C-methyltransferase [Hyphomicrobium sp.]
MHADATSLPQRVLGTRHLLLGVIQYALRAASMTFAHLNRSISKSTDFRSERDRVRTHGCVTLVGAGPGDPELLTVKAVRAIECADVILFDALVSEAVLELARRHAQLICVGKRSGHPSCRQDDINRLMVEHASAGKRVVRLKSGDPAIFGRAGEEMSYLASAGLEAQIVPGITAGSAMAAAFGISLTHRDHAKSVRFVTGHSKNGGLPEDIDWQAIADPSTTTIFYMGAPFAGEIATRLMAIGMWGDTPVGIASALSRSNERIVRCSLAELSNAISGFDRREPLILGIGEVYSSTFEAAPFRNDAHATVS